MDRTERREETLEGTSFLIVGPPLSGKTRSLDSLPGRLIHFNFELEGYQALRKPFIVVPTLRDFWTTKKQIEKTVVVDCADNLPGLIGEGKEARVEATKITNLIKDCNTLPDHLGDFDAISIDSLAPFGIAVLDFVIALNGRSVPQIQDYRDALYKTKEILFKLQSLKKIFVLLAHFQTEKDEITGRARQVPQVWGSNLPQDIVKWLSTTFQAVVASTGKGDVEYKWNTKPEGLVESLGSRKWDNLPKFIPQNFEALFKMVGGQ